MRHLGALLIVLAALAVNTSARAETSPVDVGSDAGFDGALDTSFADATDATDADVAETETDSAEDAEPIADTLDTTVSDTDTTDTAITDTAVADTAPIDTGTPVDSAVPDTSRPTGPGTITENPNDPYTANTDGDGCQCHAARSGSNAGAYAALVGLLFVFTRRKHPR